jgi:hypothetical protein
MRHRHDPGAAQVPLFSWPRLIRLTRLLEPSAVFKFTLAIRTDGLADCPTHWLAVSATTLRHAVDDADASPSRSATGRLRLCVACA